MRTHFFLCTTLLINKHSSPVRNHVSIPGGDPYIPYLPHTLLPLSIVCSFSIQRRRQRQRRRTATCEVCESTYSSRLFLSPCRTTSITRLSKVIPLHNTQCVSEKRLSAATCEACESKFPSGHLWGPYCATCLINSCENTYSSGSLCELPLPHKSTDARDLRGSRTENRTSRRYRRSTIWNPCLRLLLSTPEASHNHHHDNYNERACARRTPGLQRP